MVQRLGRRANVTATVCVLLGISSLIDPIQLLLVVTLVVLVLVVVLLLLLALFRPLLPPLQPPVLAHVLTPAMLRLSQLA
jgi:hypothetical protein